MELFLLVLTIIGGIASVIAIIEYCRRIEFNSIQVESFKMNPPGKSGGIYVREPVSPDKVKFANMENNLRQKAYRISTVKTEESFYDDSDMHAEYYLYVVYNSKDETPLLSIRLYYSAEDIKAELEGTNPAKSFNIYNPDSGEMSAWTPDEIDKYEFGQCFIVDRMSANLNNDFYKANRGKIAKCLYKEIYRNNRTAKVFYALARRSVKEALLTKYLRLGLRIIGMSEYYGKDHWVLEGRFHCIKSHFKYMSRLHKGMKSA